MDTKNSLSAKVRVKLSLFFILCKHALQKKQKPPIKYLSIKRIYSLLKKIHFKIPFYCGEIKKNNSLIKKRLNKHFLLKILIILVFH